MIRDYDEYKLATPPGFGEGEIDKSKGVKVGSKEYNALKKEWHEINERTGWNKYLSELKLKQIKN